jgi:pullulanase
MNTPMNNARQLACLLFTAWGSAVAATPAHVDPACDAAKHFEVLAEAPPMEARGIWLAARTLRWPGAEALPAGGRFVLHHAERDALRADPGVPVQGATRSWVLAPAAPLTEAQNARWRYLAAGPTLALPALELPALRAMHRGQLLLVAENSAGQVLQATALQHPGALDELYEAAETAPELGASPAPRRTTFRLWAPTATRVALCVYGASAGPAQRSQAMQRDERTGVWSHTTPADLSGRYYTYVVDVFVRGTGWVRNRVTDPYAVSLSANSARTYIANLDSDTLQPAGWRTVRSPHARVKAATDLQLYELHVRDFSFSDATVRPAWRGKYLAFTEPDSLGMRHLRALSQAGITDIHLLPVFDIATVPEQGCLTPEIPRAAPDSAEQQAAVTAAAARDCFNWGYDPWHFNAPEGSYASDTDAGARRIVELRQMVLALHEAGLRVGMDVVYNHTTASGQDHRSVLDRIVPGYYQRLNAAGKVETSTCCDNTATEHRMMARLMSDSLLLWARHYRMDSFRFDLMGHQPRAAMEAAQARLKRELGREIHFIGEGWNFGEVANNARFRQASQLELGGSGIATFSDRLRDGARGGGHDDSGERAVSRQGWLNGQHYAPNALGAAATREQLLHSADLVRVGLAGTLRQFRMQAADGQVRELQQLRYAGQAAGYTEQPGEVVNYVENHDNQTLFDLNALRLPAGTSADDRARVQVLGGALTAFAQGVAYWHAGIELLRSKSLDRNSYDSGDWFNRLDFSLQDNGFAAGLPRQADNGHTWAQMRPVLADGSIKPGTAQIRFTRDAFLDLMRIRASTTLLRLRSAADVMQRLRFFNTGPQQVATVVAAHVDGRGLEGANFAGLVYLVNADVKEQRIAAPELAGQAWVLHPVHLAATAADPRPAAAARWDAARAEFTIPPRTALAWVQR